MLGTRSTLSGRFADLAHGTHRMTAGLMAGSSALMADALDMLADASAFALALSAVERSSLFKRRAVLASGALSSPH